MTLTAWLRVQKREVEARKGAREWGEARIKGSLGSNERGDEREANSWRSPRDRKQAEQLSLKEKILLASTKPPAKSSVLSRSYGESGSRNSSLHNHRSLAFGSLPSQHFQQPLNKSLDSSKSTDPKLTITPNKSDKEPDAERPSIEPRKFSVDSKDSDNDSAISSLPEGNVNRILKGELHRHLDYGDKVSGQWDSERKDPAPAHKTWAGETLLVAVQPSAALFLTSRVTARCSNSGTWPKTRRLSRWWLKNKPVRSSVGRGSARGSPGCRGVFYRRSRPKYVWPEGLWKCSQEAGRKWQQINLQPIFLNKFHFSLICQELLYEGKNLYFKIIVESENDPILEL